MSEHNNDPVQGNDEKNEDSQSNQDKGKGKGNLLIDYSLTPIKNAAVFTLHKQHLFITDFLNKVGMFQASNGIQIGLGYGFPEWKESLGIIYLDGTGGKALNRPDVTRFAPVLKYRKNVSQQTVVKGREARDNRMQRFHDAIAELARTVSSVYSYKESESDKRDTGRVRVVG